MKLDIREWKILWFFFKPYKIECLGVAFLMLLSGLLDTLNLVALYPLINYGFSLGNKNIALQAFEKATQFISKDNPFWAACVLLIAVSILAIGCKFVYNYFSNKLLVRMVGDIQKKIFAKLIAADYDFYVKNQQGTLIYAGTTAPERTSLAIFSAITLAYQSINGLFLFSSLVFLSWQGTAVILVLGLLYSAVTGYITRNFIQKCAAVRVEESQHKNIVLNEFITGIKLIKIYLASKAWEKRHTRAVDGLLSNQFRMLMGGAFPEAFVKFIFFAFLALTGMYLSQNTHGGNASLLPAFGIFIVLVNRFLPAANWIGTASMKIAECMPDVKIVHEFCSEGFKAVPEGAGELGNFGDQITFEGVYFKYASMTDYLLRDLSFSIERRKMTALVGLSGSGKTTIINLLLKLYRPDRGAIKIDGTDIQELSNKSYLSKIGYVSQETFIFNSTIKENIRFGMDNCTDAMIEEAAKSAYAHEFIVETADGYETVVGDSGVKLSGGQRQRIAIARAMLRKPRIIVLDEATSSLDNISEQKIQKAINDISKHTTVLVIAHRLSTVRNADKIIILQKGDIKEQGTHEELFKNKNLYYDLHMTKEVVNGEA